MSFVYQISCTKCSQSNDINNDFCDNCGLPVPGTINTRRASLKTEVDALEKRYTDSVTMAKNRGLLLELSLLENLITLNSRAVINMDFDFLWEWLIKRKSEYISYRRQIISGRRSRAAFENDVNRTTADSILFGSNDNIIYSALTVDEKGLTSYGEASVILKTSAVETRISALETNSFVFIDRAAKNGWSFGQPLPAGYMSVWTDKQKLAVAKLTDNLKSGVSEAEISRLILLSDGNRKNDTFIELYVYGQVAPTIVEKIKLPVAIQRTTDRKKIFRLKEISKKFNIEFYS